jgi:hypothetical protein
VLGWHRNLLVLGLPLLMGLDTKQLAAVIAHEFGHLRGGHGKLGAWVYRTRRSWWLLANARQRSRIGASLADVALDFFFQHFFPRFNARAFVLSRQQEVEADRLAQMTVGAPVAGQSLMALAVLARYLSEQFWPQVYAQAERLPAPQAQPMREMRTALKGALHHAEAARWLREALKSLPEASDTHPSLRDRLEQAEVEPRLGPPPTLSAADHLLGHSLPVLIQVLDEQWRSEVAEQWTALHQRQRQRERLLVELARRSAALGPHRLAGPGRSGSHSDPAPGAGQQPAGTGRGPFPAGRGAARYRQPSAAAHPPA